MMKLSYLFGVGLLLYASVGFSARLKSYCVIDESGKEISGQNIDDRMPIASVSKLFTSLLAVNSNSLTHKVYTQFYYTQIKSDVYDVHIRGSHEPYFSRQTLHWMIAKLNEAGVKKIRNLTFDENFKYFHDTDRVNRIGRRSLNPVSGKADLNGPSAEEVRLQLSQNAEIFKQYEKSVKEALENGVQLPKKLIFFPEKISVLASNLYTPGTETKKAYVASPDLLHMLKMMNWNSNNHAANQIFQISGGITAFRRLFYDKLGLSEKEVIFINGSGQNANLKGDGREYNEATCKTVVKTVRALKQGLEAQKAKLQDAMSVMGGDIGSTVGGKTYTTPLTKMSVIAKTGTVGTNITLAGMISTQTGKYFFFYNVEVNSAPSRARNKTAWVNTEAARARNIISYKLAEQIKKFGGPLKIDYKPQFFNLENFEEALVDDVVDSEAANVNQ